MKTIIAPTDFSDVSYNACLYAAKMAHDVQAQLILLHVMELPITVSEFPVLDPVYDETITGTKLQELKNSLLSETQGKVQIQTANILGSVEYELKELCNIEKPFAVVMGTHSYNMLERFFVGSTAAYSARHLHYPVLIVPAGASYKPLRKIALACDLKNIYSIPLEEIEKMLNAFGASLDVFHVHTKQTKFDESSVEYTLLRDRLLHLDAKFFTVENTDVQRGIATLATRHDTDLILIIPRKHGPFHKAWSNEFIFYSSVPVMAVHEGDVVQESEEPSCGCSLESCGCGIPQASLNQQNG